MRGATTRWWEESSGESVYLEKEIWFIFSNARFFFVLLFEIYTSFLVKGFYAINRCVAMEAFFLGWNSLSTFGNVFWVLFLYFVRASSLFWERNAYWVVRKIQRQFNNVRIVCFGGFYLFIGFVLFPLRILLGIFSRIFMRSLSSLL